MEEKAFVSEMKFIAGTIYIEPEKTHDAILKHFFFALLFHEFCLKLQLLSVGSCDF